MIMDYPAELISPGIFVADVIPLRHRRFPSNRPFALVLHYGLYVLPRLLSAKKRTIAGGTDTPALYLTVIFSRLLSNKS